MTTQHTIESPTEYTPEEQIAALRKLGAEIEENMDAFGDKYLFIRLPGEPYTFNSLVEAETFLRTDESAWMKMDDVLAKEYGNMGFFHIIESGLLPTNKWIYCVAGFWGRHGVVMNAKAETVQAAVYSVFMQFIREDMKR